MPKIVIFIIVGLIILAGAGVAVMQQMGMGPFAPDTEAEAGTDNPGTKKPVDKEVEPPAYLPVDAMVIPVFQGDKLAMNIQLEMQIEIGKKDVPEMRKQMPLLRDAFLRDLHGYVPHHLRDNKELDIDILGRRLVVIAERAIGKRIVQGVLIQSILNRPSK